ncbi:MAG TPA: Hsp20/alpha crystallin family protein [Rhabdochlamydiaceae bacterium]|nr:Hsp20/alpha crystallin family protein [Rhabdochlamydiaceae bacterium]
MRFPFSLLDEGEEEGWLQDFSDPSGLSVYEDEKSITIEAALPGLNADEIEMTFDKGILWIKGEKKEEEKEKNKKYYRKAISTFSYRVAVPGDIDEQVEPDAVFKDGMLKVYFPKSTKTEPKKIGIKKG